MYSVTAKRVSKSNPKKVKSRHTFYGKTVQAAKSAMRSFFGRSKQNIAEGAYYGGVFHPYRRSPDYSRARAGEGRSKVAKKARKRQVVRKYHKKARRRRTAIS